MHFAELPGEHRELYIEERGPTGFRAVALADNARDAEARHLLAHGLAHAALHVGNRISRHGRTVWSGRHEEEAEDFAACLLIDSGSLRRHLAALDPPSAFELAEAFGVSESLVLRRVALLGANAYSAA